MDLKRWTLGAALLLSTGTLANCSQIFGGADGGEEGRITSAVLIGAGIDTWNLFYLGISRLESPLYARLALQGIHDAESLGSRVILEIAGALSGVALGWQWFSKKTPEETSANSDEKTGA